MFLYSGKESAMRTILVPFSIAVLFMAFLVSCSGGPDKDDNFLVRVNDYTISGDEIDSQLKVEAKLDSNFYVSSDTRTEFVKDLIQKQLLIQEARKRKLDERELFRQTIQRYWESTLIRDLLAEKGKEIRKKTVVSEQEIKEYYEANKEFFEGQSFADVQKEIAEKVEDRKVTAGLQSWIGKLKSAAKIEIRDAELATKIKARDKM